MTDLAALLPTISPTGRRELAHVARTTADPDTYPHGAHIEHAATRSALESRGLITVNGRGHRCTLTDLGRQVLDHLAGDR